MEIWQRKAKLEIVMDEKGIRTEIKGNPADAMLLAKIALQQTEKALKKCPRLSDEEALSLMDEVVESWRTEACYGREIAAVRGAMKMIEILARR